MPNKNEGSVNQGVLGISIKATEHENLALEELTKFLYEFNLLYEISRLVVDPRYSDYSITQATSSRVVSRLEPQDKLGVQTLRLSSPLDLNLILNASEVALTAIGVVLTAIGLRQNANRPGDNKASFSRDVPSPVGSDDQAIVLADSGLQLRLPPPDGVMREKLEIRKATKHYERERKRLNENLVQVEEITITYSREPGSPS